MADDVIKSFLVALNFKVDGQGERRVTETITTVTKAAETLSLALAAAALAAAAAVAKIAASFDQLYYVSQRTGASVQNIRAMSYAFSQVGSSSSAAVSALEAYSKAIRTNPGVGQYVKDLGVKQTGDAFTDLSAAIDKISAKNPHFIGAQMAGILGISEEDYLTFTKYRKERREFEDESRRTAKMFGLDADEAAAASNKFMRSLGSLQMTAQTAAQAILVKLVPSFTAFLDKIRDWIQAHPQEIEDALKAIGAAALSLATALSNIAVALTPVVKGFASMASALTGHDGLQASLEVFATFLVGTWLVRILGAFAAVGTGWGGMLALLGIGGVAALVAGAQSGKAIAHGGRPDAGLSLNPGDELPGLGSEHSSGGGKSEGGGKSAGIYGRVKAAVKRGLGLDSSSGTQARSPEASGRYRPVYKLSDADLDQAVVNTIAGEVSTKNGEGVDAVINNMMNRVGSKGWGPSGNLREVARAKGQYAGYRAAGAAESEFVRSRIRAIATGGVPDNTSGSNSYRAESYYRGEGANRTWARTSKMGPNVAGNRYGYVPGIHNGPYAPYDKPKEGTASFSLPFDPKGFNPNAIAPPALGSNTTNNSNSSNVSMNHNTTIKIDGAADPAAVGAQVERATNRSNDLSLRNAQSAIR